MKPIRQLPSYRTPPVTEVVASVQFEPLSNFNVVHYGLLWKQFGARFPRVEQRPPLAPIVERLGVRVPVGHIQLQLADDMNPRLWFLTETGDELIQVQSDRFIRNWRAVPQLERPYPRYEDHIRPKFLEDYQVFQQFLSDELNAKISPNQCEITYINHITPNDHWASHRNLAAVFRGWSSSYLDAVDQPVESINMHVVHQLNDDAGEFLGRLHVTVQSVFRTDSDNPIFALTLTARGKPIDEGELGVLKFFDLGRRAIVTAFDGMTTPEMHKVWGKKT